MGQAVSFIQDDQKRTAEGNEKEAKDALNVMKVLAQEKMENFKAKIFSGDVFESHMIPIDKIVFHDNVLRAAVENNAKDVGSEIGEALGSFATGKFVDGITTILKKGLDVLLGSYSANDSEKQRYIISVSPILGVFRIDYYMYSYRFTSESLKKLTSSVTLVVFVISSADVSKMNANTCKVIISQTFGALPVDEQKALANDLIEAVENSNAKNITAGPKTILASPAA